MLKAARRKLYNKSEATDVVQEAWVRILERQSTLRAADKLIPWAKAIAANLASNVNRAKREAFLFDDYLQTLSARDPVAQPELLAELSDMLGRLDPLQNVAAL